MSEPTAAAKRVQLFLGREEHVARMVDDQTGLPELIAACEAARKGFKSVSSVVFAAEIHAIDAALRIAQEGRK